MNSISQAVQAPTAQLGDLVHLVGPKDKNFIIKLTQGEQLHTHVGLIKHDDLVGCTWGSKIISHIGKVFTLLPPALDDILREVPRKTQILYPKDIGYILVSMGISPGAHVVEAGTGSGAFTIALAHAVGPQGHVTTFERRQDFQAAAIANLKRVGLEDRVTFKLQDIDDGFGMTAIQSIFLDLPNPEMYIPQVRAAMMPGGFFGSILPTTNQVSLLISALDKHAFSFIEVSEIMHRYYKPIAARLRPVDRMVAHTGYLIFARPVDQIDYSQDPSTAPGENSL
ncbi:MAG: tRNA (adenine-N1)-methyltransferase [Anaerolineae bacterium]|nr:tRNA (adenine-N1)-methyltransferase [Anaerolineae bacterium]